MLQERAKFVRGEDFDLTAVILGALHCGNLIVVFRKIASFDRELHHCADDATMIVLASSRKRASANLQTPDICFNLSTADHGQSHIEGFSKLVQSPLEVFDIDFALAGEPFHLNQ